MKVEKFLKTLDHNVQVKVREFLEDYKIDVIEDTLDTIINMGYEDVPDLEELVEGMSND